MSHSHGSKRPFRVTRMVAAAAVLASVLYAASFAANSSLFSDGSQRSDASEDERRREAIRQRLIDAQAAKEHERRMRSNLGEADLPLETPGDLPDRQARPRNLQGAHVHDTTTRTSRAPPHQSGQTPTTGQRPIIGGTINQSPSTSRHHGVDRPPRLATNGQHAPSTVNAGGWEQYLAALGRTPLDAADDDTDRSGELSLLDVGVQTRSSAAEVAGRPKGIDTHSSDSGGHRVTVGDSTYVVRETSIIDASLPRRFQLSLAQFPATNPAIRNRTDFTLRSNELLFIVAGRVPATARRVSRFMYARKIAGVADDKSLPFLHPDRFAPPRRSSSNASALNEPSTAVSSTAAGTGPVPKKREKTVQNETEKDRLSHESPLSLPFSVPSYHNVNLSFPPVPPGLLPCPMYERCEQPCRWPSMTPGCVRPGCRCPMGPCRVDAASRRCVLSHYWAGEGTARPLICLGAKSHAPPSTADDAAALRSLVRGELETASNTTSSHHQGSKSSAESGHSFEVPNGFEEHSISPYSLHRSPAPETTPSDPSSSSHKNTTEGQSLAAAFAENEVKFGGNATLDHVAMEKIAVVTGMSQGTPELSLVRWQKATSWLHPQWRAWADRCVAPTFPEGVAEPHANFHVVGGNKDVERAWRERDKKAPTTKPHVDALTAGSGNKTESAESTQTESELEAEAKAAKRRKESEKGQAFGAHWGDGIYRMENICIGTWGRLYGFKPQMQQFVGLDEMGYISGQRNRLKERLAYPSTWIKDVAPMNAPPTCVFQTQVLLVPIYKLAGNHGHALRRIVTAMLMRSDPDLFDPKAGEVLVVFAMTQIAHPNDVDGFVYLQQLLTSKWASVWTFKPGQEYLKYQKLNTMPPREFVCFKKVVVAQSCTAHWEKGGKTRACDDRTKPGAQYYFPLAHQERRMPEDQYAQQLLRSAAAACVGLTHLRTRPNLRHPRVIYSHRSRVRRMVGLDLDRVANLLQDHGARSFNVVEYASVDPVSVFRLWLDADFAFGMFGSGLTWQLLMPPGSTVAMVDFFGQHKQGWGKCPGCDYGGDAVISGTHLLSLPFNYQENIGGHVRVQFDVKYITEALFDQSFTLLRCGAAQQEHNTIASWIAINEQVKKIAPHLLSVNSTNTTSMRSGNGTTVASHGARNSTDVREVLSLSGGSRVPSVDMNRHCPLTTVNYVFDPWSVHDYKP